jgi:putative transposase
LDELDKVVLAVAREDEHATDGTRMIAAIASRRAGRAINRKRCQRLMREHRLLQPVRSEGRRRRPGYFQVTRPDELWHLDMTSVWVAEHGWTYLNAAIDCCTREITGWSLDVRCRAEEAIAVIEHAASERDIQPGQLTSAPTTAAPTPPAAYAHTSPLARSRTAAAATATPRARPSSSPGSANSSCAASGAKSSKPSTKPAPPSAPTSTTTTTDPTAASPTRHPAKSPRPGKTTTTT